MVTYGLISEALFADHPSSRHLFASFNNKDVSTNKLVDIRPCGADSTMKKNGHTPALLSMLGDGVLFPGMSTKYPTIVDLEGQATHLIIPASVELW